MIPERTVVFVNSQRVNVPRGATLRDAVRAWNESEAGAVELGEQIVTDSRGLAASLDAPVHGGAIFRIVPARSRALPDD